MTLRTPSLAAVAIEFPAHRYSQAESAEALGDFAGPEFRRFFDASGVASRHLALPLSRYAELTGFSEANDIFIDVALDLAEQALLRSLDAAKLKPADVDVVFSTTVTGLAVPTLDARLAARVGLRPDVKRVPLFGLGCVAGAAGVARMYDYLRAYPDQVAALVAVELCSLTIQRDDRSMANFVAASLFGDGAGAVIATGANRHPAGPRVLATRSRLYPDTQDVMGWDIGTNGFRIKLSVEVATVVEKYLAEDVRNFLADCGLSPDDVTTYVSHPGGPKVIEAVQNVLDLPANALDRTRKSLRENGNLSSVSVLDVLRATMAEPPPPGSLGLMVAMGPGFCCELVLLSW
ncbi:type III polyketide synthase [Mycolicibacter minnesotensis]|uniref:Type III polyketide synthase n=1 Tax=Mycolicibacter minnesotensis TaxID=1118379 RepID=A0A7I7R2R7_9MYCO|nr:3-oxoacyl-[acyl-carrier-protein] synthase III C-terminal domain-containing protein [Mycolicibacter minnesotensis]ORA99760.1 type III polyketide synthase [Mycolicibacter minnesotensis]BBY32939.1 polyketide synthase [Mycolicibacter minnesotensis]